VQVTAIMLDFEEAKRNLALPMHGLLINGGTAHAIGCSAHSMNSDLSPEDFCLSLQQHA